MTERIVCLKCGREGHHSSTCKRTMIGYGSKFSADAEDGIQNALLSILSHPDGLRGTAVAELIGLGPDSAKSKLRELRRRGEIEPAFLNGNTWLWMVPSDAKAFSAGQYEAMRVKDATRRNVRRAIAAARRSEEECDPPIVKRLISANLAAPLRPAGPRSVFEVARG